jgi:alcohol dehydrogenase
VAASREIRVEDPHDAIVRVDAVTIRGTDLHILKGYVPEVTGGWILGHEAVGTEIATGDARGDVSVGDRVLVSCFPACGRCRYCREARYGQRLRGGGWILGHSVDGTQAEYVRVPFADLVPLENTIRAVTCADVVGSSGALVLVDQAP